MGIQRKLQIYVQISTELGDVMGLWLELEKQDCWKTFYFVVWSPCYSVHFLSLLWKSLRDGVLSHSESPSQRQWIHVLTFWTLYSHSSSSSGVAEMEMAVPDTITEWKAGALCLSNDTGLGLSSVVPLQAFQPFFVELTLPYSVIRGEAFILTATVLNYLPTSMRVNTFLN